MRETSFYLSVVDTLHFESDRLRPTRSIGSDPRRGARRASRPGGRAGFALHGDCIAEVPLAQCAMNDASEAEVFKSLLSECAPGANSDAVLKALGVERLADFEVLNHRDIVEDCQLKAVQAQKLMGKVLHYLSAPACSSSPDIISNTVADDTAVQEKAFSSSDAIATGYCEAGSGDDGDEYEDVDFDFTAALEEEEATNDQAEAEDTVLPRKHVKEKNAVTSGKESRGYYRKNLKRPAAAQAARLNGMKRVALRVNHSLEISVSDTHQEKAQMGSASGEEMELSDIPVVSSKTCSCSTELDQIIPQISTAIRTHAERRTRAKKSKQPIESVSTYNLARLAPFAVSLFFDPIGNWLYHGVCIRKKLGLGHSWLSATHRRAVQLSKIPVLTLKKKEIRDNEPDLYARIVVPEGVVKPVRDYYRDQKPDDIISLIVSRSNLHGLYGAKSNRTKSEARKFFINFTRNNSAPNGRTRDSSGRFHGAPNYLDARFQLYLEEKDGEKRLGFADEAVRAMSVVEPFKSNPKLLIRPSTARSLLTEFFGKIKFVNGEPVFNEEYTVRYPQKTDACSDCVRFNEQLRADRQSLKRHEQQSDRTLDRLAAIKELEISVSEHEAALKLHRDIAGKASKFHKDCVDTAYSNHQETLSSWNDLMALGSDASDSDIEAFVLASGDGWFDMSSDYQQDKSFPSWRQSAQPGPTYYLSGVTNYVHIIVQESCGLSTGPTRKSRNIVYIRDERVAGSKTSDDTLSTICDSLLAPPGPTAEQPSKFRTGYDIDGKLM